MKLRYMVTFEYDNREPQSHQGIVLASQLSTCARLGVAKAQKILRPRNWRSVVFVALERLGQEEEHGRAKNNG